MENRQARAGSLESSDLLVVIEEKDPGEGLEIVLSSIVEKQYGDKIRQVAEDTLKALGLSDVKLMIQDRGALDYAIRARIETAAGRLGKEA